MPLPCGTCTFDFTYEYCIGKEHLPRLARKAQNVNSGAGILREADDTALDQPVVGHVACSVT
jgi:hypothetical protein